MAGSRMPARASQPSPPPAAAPRVSVLVVSVDTHARDAAVRALREAEHGVFGARSGEEALALTRGGGWDVLAFDTRTEAYGLPLLEALRERVRPMPVLVGMAELREAEVFCREHDVPLFVSTPVDAPTLRRAVDAAAELAWESKLHKHAHASGVMPVVRKHACVVVVGAVGAGEGLREALPPSLRNAHLALVDTPEHAAEVLRMIIPDLLVLDDVEAHDRLRADATTRAIPELVRGLADPRAVRGGR
jgi:CheY-like chemotaxis protein